MEEPIADYFVNLLRSARSLLVGEADDASASKLEQTSINLTLVHEKLTEISTLMANLRRECQDRAAEMRDAIELQANASPQFPFAVSGKSKNMLWGDMADIEDRRDSVMNKVEAVEAKLREPPQAYKTLDSLGGAAIPKPIKLRMVAKLGDLAPAFAWYDGDKKNKPGMYIRLPENLFIRVPFPDVIDSSQNYARNKTIKCKYETEEQCSENRKFLANKYSTELRACLFAHSGDEYTKVGTNFRCPVNPRFGSHRHFKADVAALSANDIKPLIMYALSDLAAVFVWNAHHYKSTKAVFDNVEICQ